MSATAMCGLAGQNAFAQVDPATESADAMPALDEASGERKLDTITVTGSRREASIQDSTINIQAISSEDLELYSIEDIADLASFTPGMSVPDTGPRSSGQIILRGLNADSLRSDGTDFSSALAVYLGETPLYQDLKFIDIARVETLLGPQGTLYGRGTLAGAIRYIPNRPNADEFDFGVRASAYGVSESEGTGYTGEGFVNLPLVSGKLAFRSVIGYYDDPGFIDYPYLVRQPGVSRPQSGVGFDLGTPQQIEANLFRAKDVNFEETFTARNSIGFFPTDWLSVYATYAHQRTKTDGAQANGAGIFGSGNYEGPWRSLEPSDRKSDLFSIEVESAIGSFAKLVTSTAWSEQKINQQLDATDVLLDLDFGYELFPAFTAYSDSRRKREQFNAEARLVSDHEGPISWVVGGFYNQTKENRNYDEILPGISGFYGVNRPDDLEFVSRIFTDDDESAVFGEVSWQITPKFQITGGGRYYEYNAFLKGGTGLPLLSTRQFVRTGGARGYAYPEVRINSREGETSSDGFVWKANASYEFTDDLLAYFTFSEGYRIGGVNRVVPCVLPLNPAVQNTCGLPNELTFEPDTVQNKELGIRATLLDGKLVSNLALYHLDWDGIQLAGLTANGSLGITVNGGTAVSQGLEWNFNFMPTDQLSIQGSYNYLDAHLTEDVPALLQFRRPGGGAAYASAFDGDRLPGSPENSGTIGVTYDKPLESGAELTMNWTTAYVGEVVTRVGARGFGEVLPDYTTSRASIGYGKDDWRVTLYATNIFDKYAVTSVGRDRSRTFINDGVASRWFSQNVLTPRKVGVRLSYNF